MGRLDLGPSCSLPVAGVWDIVVFTESVSWTGKT